ncbi:MAG TPA: phosphatidylserine decarboxylase family protein, partial [Thermopolyspora sp.]
MSNDSDSRGASLPVRLARGASPWLVPTATGAAVTAALVRRNPRWAIAAVPLGALTGAMLWFFRDPDRRPGTGRVLSPA